MDRYVCIYDWFEYEIYKSREATLTFDFIISAGKMATTSPGMKWSNAIKPVLDATSSPISRENLAGFAKAIIKRFGGCLN